jgi:hypothetical protein
MDYFAHPRAPAKYLHTFPPLFDMESCRAAVLEGGSGPLMFTALGDVAKVVASALDYSEPWPANGGMLGQKTSMAEIIKIGEKIRGEFKLT